MYEFTTEVDINIIGSHNIQSGGGKTKIKWKLELEMREYGIKSFIITVPDQVVTSDVWRYNEETDEEYAETETIELKDVDVELDNNVLDQLFPIRLELWQGIARLEFV